MSDISRVALFGKLNSLAYKALEGATVFCKLRGNPYVELTHWIHQVLQLQNSDLHAMVRALDLDAGKLARDLTASLDRLPRGATAISDLSPHFVDAVERAWVWATLKYGASQVRTGHILLALLKTPGLRSIVIGISREFEKIKTDQLTDEFEQITSG
jgi:type VI secretion system protein VasG